MYRGFYEIHPLCGLVVGINGISKSIIPYRKTSHNVKINQQILYKTVTVQLVVKFI